MRKTSRELSRLFGIKKIATPGFVPAFSLVAVGTNKQLKFNGKIEIDGVQFGCANDNGTIKSFGDVDDFLKFAAKTCEKGDGIYTVVADTGALLASSVPANMKTWAAAQIVKLGKTKTTQTGVIAAIDDQLALMVGWDVGNAAQQARLIEVQAQRAAVVTDVAAIDTEVARLTVIANS